jgi:hypothetical protein
VEVHSSLLHRYTLAGLGEEKKKEKKEKKGKKERRKENRKK